MDKFHLNDLVDLEFNLQKLNLHFLEVQFFKIIKLK